jgi:fatty acid desaturase
MAGLSASPDLGLNQRSMLRTYPWDALMVLLAVAHAVILFSIPTVSVLALGLWWNSNTISHNFVHRRFFRGHAANSLFSLYLSLLLGIPQSLWRDFHLAHHAGIPRRLEPSSELAVEATLVVALWAAMLARAPAFFIWVYLPGYIAGLGLCALHGYYEHAGGITSHYGRVYNLLFFNDGYHAEHHAKPGLHWEHLKEYHESVARVSAWPAPLRWIEIFSLETLERLVVNSRRLQRFVLRTHARAFREVCGALPGGGRVAVVGGGLFPRTALVLADLLPAARITIIDASKTNLDQARTLLGTSRGTRSIDLVNASYAEYDCSAYDLVVIPLSFNGDREAIYTQPPAPAVLVHDWIWRKRGLSRVVSIVLLKRLNLVRR